MAASPVGLVATAFLPASMTHTEALLLYESIQQEAERLDCPLVGGDTCIQRRESDSGIHLTVTVLGSAARPVSRSGAKAGDRIFVTGPLGGSFASGRHLAPPVRIPEAPAQLRSCLGDDLHAMIDISDGLGKDAMAIASSSHVRFVLESRLIPCHPGSNWQNALQDGEDHASCCSPWHQEPVALPFHSKSSKSGRLPKGSQPSWLSTQKVFTWMAANLVGITAHDDPARHC